MSGYLVHVGAQVLCAHTGQAQPMTPNMRVTVGGQPTVLITAPYIVAGCTLSPPPTANGPCVTAQWLNGTTRVTSNKQRLVFQNSNSTCTPTGTPLQIINTQTRVTAT